MLICYAAIEMRTHSTEKLLKPFHLYTEHLRISTTQLHSTLEGGVNTSHVDFWGSTLPSGEACLELFKQQQGVQQGSGQQRTRHGGVRPVVQGLAGCSQDSAFTPSKMENHWRTVSRAVIGSHWHSKISLAARLMTEWMNEQTNHTVLFCFLNNYLFICYFSLLNSKLLKDTVLFITTLPVSSRVWLASSKSSVWINRQMNLSCFQRAAPWFLKKAPSPWSWFSRKVSHYSLRFIFLLLFPRCLKFA